jgi:hypothetical protein
VLSLEFCDGGTFCNREPRSPRPERYVDDAARCYRLASRSTDRELVRHLVALGNEYVAKAIQLGADPIGLPQQPRNIGL